MQIDRDTVVALQYVLYDADGNVIEKTDEPVEYLHGGYQNIFERVERELEGKAVGETCRVKLTPEDAFGDYDAELVHVEPRDKFPPDVSVGMQFRGDATESGQQVVYTVTDIAEDKIVVDGNHPLAGQTLNFECTVTAVRAATGEELEHGHVHGAHGHHH